MARTKGSAISDVPRLRAGQFYATIEGGDPRQAADPALPDPPPEEPADDGGGARPAPVASRRDYFSTGRRGVTDGTLTSTGSP